MKKAIYILAALVVVGGIAWGGTVLWKSKAEKPADACAYDVANLVVTDNGSYKTDEAIVRAVFDSYFNGYKKMVDCKASAVKDASLASVSNIRYDDTEKKHFLADIKFDLAPLYPEGAAWVSPGSSTTTKAGWITGKTGTLSIRKGDGIFYLVIF